MGTKTITYYVSDVDQEEIREAEAYQLTIRHPDGSTQQLDISARNYAEMHLAGLGRTLKKRGRKAGATTNGGRAKPKDEQLVTIEVSGAVHQHALAGFEDFPRYYVEARPKGKGTTAIYQLPRNMIEPMAIRVGLVAEQLIASPGADKRAIGRKIKPTADKIRAQA